MSLSPNFTVFNAVKTAFAVAFSEAFPVLEGVAPIITTANPKHGDYQCNSAMALFKSHKEALGNPVNPKAVGEKLLSFLSKDIFISSSVAPQGFISVTLNPDWLKNILIQQMNSPIERHAEKSLSCLVDFSSPNIAKEMHVGHLRSTILGESICRVLEFSGHRVMRVNHLGDWGTQFGMLIEFMTESFPNFRESPPNISDLTSFYKQAKMRFDSDEAFKKRAQMNVPLLQKGDPVARDAWILFCDISRKEFQQIYDRVNVKLIERGESFYNDMIAPIVAELTAKDLLTVTDGATCFFVEDDPKKKENEVPLMLVKSDGGYGYDSTDVAAIKHRLVIEKHDWVIYVTDLGQESHFFKIFKAAQILGWYSPPTNRVDHVGFGLVQGEDGKKFKTRSGDVVKLTDLLDEAVERALKEIQTRREEEAARAKETVDGSVNCSSGPDQACNNNSNGTVENGTAEDFLSDEDAAKAIGFSAIKYFDLKQNRTTNYRFSYDKMLDPKGNTAVYLLYAYARICAIFRKAGVNAESLNPDKLVIVTAQERNLAFQMLKLYEITDSILEDLHVHRIAEYMYDLSGVFTSFYQNCKVVGDPNQESRLILCELTRRFLEKSFHILGITPLTKI